MKYFLCSNLECACPIPEGQDFCDNCNTPSSWFMRPAELNINGPVIGQTDDGLAARVSLDHIHYGFYGMTKTGKTRLAMKLAVEAENLGIKLLVIDPEGEWKDIIPLLKGKTEYYLSLKNLKINPFDLKDKGLISLLLKETIFQQGKNDFYEFTPSMEALLDECIRMSCSIPELIDNVRDVKKEDLKTKLVNIESTRTAVLVRLRPLEENESLRQVFYCDKSSIDLERLDDRNIIIDFHDLDSKVAYSRPLRLLYNVITIAGLTKALRKEATDRIENMIIADEAQKLVPKIFEKETATDTWIAVDYAVRLRRRGYVLVIVSQHPKNIEDDIRDNIHVNFFFRTHSEENARIIAGILGYSHYARVDHICQRLVNLKFREAVAKMPDVPRPFTFHSIDFNLVNVSSDRLQQFMPKVEHSPSDDEQLFLHNMQACPFISVVERRSMLGWDEDRYSSIVERLTSKGIIEKQNVRLGQGRPRLLYQLSGQKPSIKHEYYVHWIMNELESKGISCLAGKAGPDVQIPSIGVAVNVELGSSNIYGNIPKALNDFTVVIICSDEKSVLDAVSARIKAENVLCALVQDVPALVEKMRFNAGRTNI